VSFGTPSHARDQGHRLVEQGYVSSITDERLANGRTIFTVTLYSGTVYKWSPHQLECFALGTRVSRAGSPWPEP
jgi:hypothetical protein